MLANKGLHQTGRGGVAFASRRRPVVEARPAGEARCCAGRSGGELLRSGVLALLLSLPGMGCHHCPKTERGYATSQDGAITAVERVTECGGATVADYTEVVLRTGPEAKQASGGAMVFQVKGNASVGMEWTASRVLRLRVASTAEVTTFRPELGGVAVTLDRREPEGAR